MNKLFSELVDIPQLQGLLDSLYDVTGVASNIVDNDLTILAKTGWTDICVNFHRAHPVTEEKCLKSAKKIFDNMNNDSYIAYKCLNGLYDCACPIVVNGNSLAILFVAQFLLEQPDVEVFRNQARFCGFDESAYIDALHKVPIITEEKLVKIMKLYSGLASILAEMGLRRLKQMESFAALRESEEKYRSLVNNINVGIYRNTVNPEEGFIQANPALAKIFGYDSIEEFMKTSVNLHYQNPKDRERLIEDAKRDGIIKNKEMGFNKNDGTPIWCSLSTTVHYDKQGHIKWMDGIVEDITERKKAKVALQQAHDQLEQKVEEKTQELTSLNEELTAMNEELTAMNEEIQTINETLVHTNQRLQNEIAVKQQIEAELLMRERQYLATTSLLTRPIDEVDNCLKLILQNALQLIKAPDGFIGLYYEDGNTVLIHHGIGIHASREIESIQGNLGIQQQVYETGELLYVPDYKKYSQRIYDQRLERLSSIIALPLKQGGEVKGVLAASWVDQVHPVSEEDIAVLRQFSYLASVALERSNIHEQNCYMAFHDALTNLPNRASLNTRLEEELKMARNGESAGVLLFIDIDDFKSVNDNFGHSSGDQVIIAASKHISKAVGKKTFLARLGGDEFVAIVPGETSRAIAAEIAEKMVAALNREYEVADQKLYLSASIGVVIYPEDGDVAEDLLKKADIAMYTAKNADKNCWRFYEQVLLQEAYEKVMLTNSLRHALARCEMFLQYQPQLTADGRTVTGFEALLRWNNSQYGLVSPLRFIPLAEQSGLILSIGKWVLQEACQFARRLSDMGRSNLHVAINISPKQLLAEDFVSSVCDCITNAGIKPEQIVIEVTESVLIESLNESIGKLNQLRKFGISLALDDFGTGYSSLTYLKSLPVNILKIDKSFIEQSSSDELQWHVVGSIIDLGHVLGLNIVAEGVEIAAQLELLRQYGCDRIQGYIFSRPICEEDAIQFLSQNFNKHN